MFDKSQFISLIMKSDSVTTLPSSIREEICEAC